jgi:adenylate kinase family enzyme
MKVFIVGLPQSGRTTVSKALCQDNFGYIDGSAWVKSTFRDPKIGEHPTQFADEYHLFLANRLKDNPNLCINNILESISAQKEKYSSFVIDGVLGPKDLIHLFNYNEDIIIFLNRTDNDADAKDHETIGVSVMRDYCFWLSSSGLLPKTRWIEYNFKIPGDKSDQVKELGSKNTVFLMRSIDKVIDHLKHYLTAM